MKKDKAIIFASTSRLRLISCISEKPKSVNQIVKYCHLSQSAVSQHLKKLKNFGLVFSKRKGQEIYYYLTEKSLGKIAKKLLVLIEKL